jgi:hypothetical protein
MDKLNRFQRLKYLGAVATEEGTCVEEVKARIVVATVAFKKIKGTFDKRSEEWFEEEDGQDIGMVGSVVWLWNVNNEKEVVDKFNASEIWVWRRKEKVSWKDKKTDGEVRVAVGEETCMAQAIIKRKNG